MTPSTASAQYCGQSSLSVVGHPCRIIGFAPNQALFATPPHVDGRILPLVTGENVEMVAIASQAVFRFVCSVEAVCQLPSTLYRPVETRCDPPASPAQIDPGSHPSGRPLTNRPVGRYLGRPGARARHQRAQHVTRGVVGAGAGRRSSARGVPAAVDGSAGNIQRSCGMPEMPQLHDDGESL
ncbi:flagellar brake protein [Paraburkholderia sp. SIMBA_030]|uniref:flagellar brake protein n=1 Tax=Paraburkholderia sp. SIMBA_030 TaxID=3085773 RepID=UPI00397C150D